MEGPKVHSAESLEQSLKGLLKKQQNNKTNKQRFKARELEVKTQEWEWWPGLGRRDMHHRARRQNSQLDSQSTGFGFKGQQASWTPNLGYFCNLYFRGHTYIHTRNHHLI